MQGLNVLQPRFQRWLGQLGGAADCMLMEHPLLQLAHPSAPGSSTSCLSGFANGSWRDMDDLLGLSVPFEGSQEAVTIWLDGLLPQVRARCGCSASFLLFRCLQLHN